MLLGAISEHHGRLDHPPMTQICLSGQISRALATSADATETTQSGDIRIRHTRYGKSHLYFKTLASNRPPSGELECIVESMKTPLTFVSSWCYDEGRPDPALSVEMP